MNGDWCGDKKNNTCPKKGFINSSVILYGRHLNYALARRDKSVEIP